MLPHSHGSLYSIILNVVILTSIVLLYGLIQVIATFQGNLIVWSTGSSKSAKEARADSKSLDLKKDSLGIFPYQCFPLVVMDSENQDLTFQIGERLNLLISLKLLIES